MNKEVPDAWDDEWSSAADAQSQQPETEPSKKLSAKQTKAQKRAAQAEFNRQLWAEAEGPRETNYFLQSQNVVPLRQEFKAPPTLLSRKGPILQKPRPNNTAEVANLALRDKDESSEDEEEKTARQKALEDAKVQAAKDREEKQRKYEERRAELFGSASGTGTNGFSARPTSRSGASSPASLTPPGSRSSTPHRGGKRGRGRGNFNGQNISRPQQQQQLREVYDPSYAAKPSSTYLLRREQGQDGALKEVQPVREPKAPDGSGKNGAGFVKRGSL